MTSLVNSFYAKLTRLQAEAQESKTEICGYLVRNGPEISIVRSANTARNPYIHAIPAAAPTVRAYESESFVMYHSHPEGPAEFSEMDLRSAKAMRSPILLYSVPEDQWIGYGSDDLTRYVGIPYRYGTHDCWSLVRRFYADQLGIYLEDYERPPDGGWPREDIFAMNAESWGFHLVDEPRDGDVVTLKLGSSFANHMGIVVGDRLLHHQLRRLSEFTDLTGSLLRRSAGIYHHAA